MPRGDGTGPWGLGPMTGRAAGYCAGYPVPGYANPIPGRGFWGRGFGGRWFGYGRGWAPYYGAPYTPLPYYGAPYGSPYSPQEEASILREQAKAIEDELKAINERISELERQAQTEEKK